MMTSTNWLTALLVLLLGSVSVLSLLLLFRLQKLWMRIFSEQHGIPAHIMENKPPAKAEPVAEKVRRKLFSIPVPGPDWMRKKS